DTMSNTKGFESPDKISILIIEDNIELLTFLERRLNKNYDVITAINGEIGLEKTFKFIPDLIISDIVMPVKDGLSFTQMIKGNMRTSHIPVVLLTARGSEEQRIKGLETMADYY